MCKIQSIFKEYYPQYAEKYAIADHARKAAWNIINCRTEVMGGHVEKCPEGHYYRIWYNSCKHRSCPQCSTMEKEEWIQRQSARILDTHHYHVIFTIPHQLNDLWLLNPNEMTNLLFKCAKEALFGMMENEDFLGVKPGMIATLQTWGETLIFHPHVHCLVTGGGLTEDGEWKESKKGYLVPVKTLMKIFRGKFLDRLHNLIYTGEIEIPEGFSYGKLHNRLRKLRKKKWNVYTCKKYAYGEGVINYLGNYIKGGAISDRRIISYNKKEVKFYYDDNKDGSKRKVMTLKTEEFIRRFLLHVPMPHLKVVRYYGIYASCKRDELDKCRETFGQDKVKNIEKISWQDYCEKYGDLSVCPVCGERLVKGKEFKAGELKLLLLLMGKELNSDLTLRDKQKSA